MNQIKQLSVIDLHYLLKELQILQKSRIENFYLENNIFYIRIYNSQIKNRYLKFGIGKFITLVPKKIETNFPTSFILYLRKRFKNATLEKLTLFKGNRVIDLQIKTKDNTNHLIVELFSNGNIIVTNKDYLIENILYKKVFKNLELKKNKTYKTNNTKDEYSIFELTNLLSNNPTEQDLNILLTQLTENFQKSELTIVKFLALKLRIGGKYAEEILTKLQIKKNSQDYKFTKKFLKESESILTQKIQPILIKKEKQFTDFAPFKLTIFKQNKIIEKENFNETINEYFQQYETDLQNKKNNKKSKKEKLKERLKQQQEYLKEIQTKIKEFNQKGDKIYEHFTIIEPTLKNSKKILKEHNLEELKNYLFTKSPLKKNITNFNKEKQSIQINI